MDPLQVSENEFNSLLWTTTKHPERCLLGIAQVFTFLFRGLESVEPLPIVRNIRYRLSAQTIF